MRLLLLGRGMSSFPGSSSCEGENYWTGRFGLRSSGRTQLVMRMTLMGSLETCNFFLCAIEFVFVMSAWMGPKLWTW